MEVLESHSGNDESGYLLEFTYGYPSFINVLFGGGFFHNAIYYQLLYSLVKLHVHEDTLYYFHDLFLIFTQLLCLTCWYVFDSHKIYTT